MRLLERIRKHDHTDDNSGGRLDASMLRGLPPQATTTASSSAGEPTADAHIADTADAHDASAISIVDAGTYFTGTDVEAALQELGAAGGGYPAMDDLTDVDTSGVADGDVLVYDSGGSEWVPAAPGGGVTLSTVGYNTVGGSNEAWLTRKHYLKKVSLTAGQVVLNVACYMDQTADTVNSLGALIYDDNAGNPEHILGNSQGGDGQIMLMARASGGSRDPRWVQVPMNFHVPSTGDYWIAVWGIQASSRIYYDGSGSDRHFVSGGGWAADYGRYTPTTSTNKYSIRALVLG